MARICVLGPVGVWDGDAEVAVPGGKPLAALAMLALNQGRPVPVERLLIGLWGDDVAPAAGNTLQVHISTLRKRIRSAGLDVALNPAGYLLDPPDIGIDVTRFDHLLEDGRRALDEGRPDVARRALRAGLELWTGPPLSNVLTAPFAAEEAERLAQRRVLAEVLAVDADLRLGMGVTLIEEVRALAESNPYDERICGQLMVALYRAGQPAAALAALKDFRARLRDDLGLDPGPELGAIEHQVLVHDAALLLTDTASTSRSHNLSEDVSTFVGRQRECEELSARLERARLVTVTGAGGAGKTRLATRVARASVETSPDGVWFVDLSAIADPRFVLSAIGQAVNVRADDVDGLVEGLESRRLLLVVDNCEHLVDEVAGLVAELLHRCPHVSVLATSREPLAIDGETIFRIPPMRVPTADARPEDVQDSDAVALFLDRARLHAPDLDLDDRTTPSIIAICARVDGLPLAIELAAVRLSHLSLEEISHRLQQRLGLLAGVNRRGLARQQTLRALIDWSYELLDPDEQRLFEGLAVFAGGFDVAAVEAVGPDGPQTVDLLASLVDKSLVEFADRSVGRFQLLEAIREYAGERLAERGDDTVTSLRRAHACHYADLARAGGDALESGADQLDWLGRLTQDHENLRAAIITALEIDDHDRALCMIANLRQYWDARGDFREAADMATAVVDAAAPVVAPRAYGEALLVAADMLESLGELDRTVELADRAQQLALEFDEPNVGLEAALVLAGVDVRRARPDEARRRIAALDLSEAPPLSVHHAHYTDALAAMYAEDWDCARQLLEALVEAKDVSGNDRRLAMTLSNLANVQIAQGDFDAARSSLDWASVLVAPLDDASNMGYINVNRGWLELLCGDPFTASLRHRAALLNSSQDHLIVHCALLGLALCAGLDEPDGADAVRLHGVIDRSLAANSVTLDATEQRLREADRERRRDHLGVERFDLLVREGRRLPLAEAIERAGALRPPVYDASS